MNRASLRRRFFFRTVHAPFHRIRDCDREHALDRERRRLGGEPDLDRWRWRRPARRKRADRYRRWLRDHRRYLDRRGHVPVDKLRRMARVAVGVHGARQHRVSDQRREQLATDHPAVWRGTERLWLRRGGHRPARPYDAAPGDAGSLLRRPGHRSGRRVRLVRRQSRHVSALRHHNRNMRPATERGRAASSTAPAAMRSSESARPRASRRAAGATVEPPRATS